MLNNIPITLSLMSSAITQGSIVDANEAPSGLIGMPRVALRVAAPTLGAPSTSAYTNRSSHFKPFSLSDLAPPWPSSPLESGRDPEASSFPFFDLCSYRIINSPSNDPRLFPVPFEGSGPRG
jgi:hypothetical protein